LTVSRNELLIDGSDVPFRRMIYDLLYVSSNLERIRDAMAARIGASGPQYLIVMAVAFLQDGDGAPVQDVADMVRESTATVTAEAGKLSRAGLMERRQAGKAKGGTTLRLSAQGEALVTSLAPVIRDVNDRLFASLSAGDFERLRALTEVLVDNSRATVRMLS
jgi:DNA-binding MarR family transcriptional regulator